MGLMDKVKQGAGQALNKAQQGVSQVKAKTDQVQSKHQWDGLLRNLGAAVWAEQREGGPSDAVTAALAALDEHLAANGPVQAGAGTGAMAGEGAGSDDQSPEPAEPSGTYSSATSEVAGSDGA